MRFPLTVVVGDSKMAKLEEAAFTVRGLAPPSRGVRTSVCGGEPNGGRRRPLLGPLPAHAPPQARWWQAPAVSLARLPDPRCVASIVGSSRPDFSLPVVLCLNSLVPPPLPPRSPLSPYPCPPVPAPAPQFHQYQVVGRALPTEAEPSPKLYRMKLWSPNHVRAKSKFW